jgi:hypothetical protein
MFRQYSRVQLFFGFLCQAHEIDQDSSGFIVAARQGLAGFAALLLDPSPNGCGPGRH